MKALNKAGFENTMFELMLIKYLHKLLKSMENEKSFAIQLCVTSFIYSNKTKAKNEVKHSEQTIRDHLSKMQVSLLNQGGNRFYLRSKKTEIGQQLLHAVSEKSLPDLIPKEQITKYL